MRVRSFALILGIVYVIVGLLGFIPSLLTSPLVNDPTLAVNAGYGYLFGIFPVNIIHDLIHIVVGIAGILAYRSYSASRGYAKVMTIIFAILFIMGFIPVLNTTFGLAPVFGNDIWLHALTAIVAAYFGYVARPERVEAI